MDVFPVSMFQVRVLPFCRAITQVYNQGYLVVIESHPGTFLI